MIKTAQKALFALRFHIIFKFTGRVRAAWYSILGMQVGQRTALSSIFVTWPHQVKVGDDCTLEENIRFKFDGIWQPGPAIQIGSRTFIGSYCEFNITDGIVIGADSLIASGCRFIDHDHGIDLRSLMRVQPGLKGRIVIEHNVWIGCNVVVLKGVTIGTGAIVAAGAVVTKSILPNEIWAGVPARKIGHRKAL